MLFTNEILDNKNAVSIVLCNFLNCLSFMTITVNIYVLQSVIHDIEAL